MKYDDTHAQEAQLAAVDANAFDMAVMADESGKRPRYLFSSPPRGQPYAARETWRRLVVHVPDVDAPGTEQRVLQALGVELDDVPF